MASAIAVVNMAVTFAKILDQAEKTVAFLICRLQKLAHQFTAMAHDALGVCTKQPLREYE